MKSLFRPKPHTPTTDSVITSLISIFRLFVFRNTSEFRRAWFAMKSQSPERELSGGESPERADRGYGKQITRRLSSRSSFTLIELLIVIAILVILAVVVILTLNPSELMAQGRDSTRLSDMASLNSAINIYLTDSGGTGSLGTSSILYISVPDSSSTCGDLGLPALPSGWSYNCVSSTSSRNTEIQMEQDGFLLN